MQKQGVSGENVSIKKEVKPFTNEYKARIAEEDRINDAKQGPVRYAFAVSVNYTLENSGTWQTLKDGSKLWRLKVSMPGALSTNTLYDKFWLPEGAKFFVYNEETGQSIGAVTSEFIGGSRKVPIEFATAIIYGEDVTFEYYQPATVKELAVISISRIDYGYRLIDNPYQTKLRSFGDAASSHININCTQGQSWQSDKHAITRIGLVYPGGSSWGSGALINNTSNNLTPYVLTAHHLLLDIYDAIPVVNKSNSLANWIFYWEYEHPGCANSATPPSQHTTVGATIVANNPDTDFALLLLSQAPGNNYNIHPYYLGWDRSTSPGNGGVGIHHPMGDVKKISTANQIQNYPDALTWYGPPNQYAPANSHWRISFSSGHLEGGSSGSPFINNNHKVIGQLHGKIYLDSWYALYGRFDVSWTGNGATDSRRRLKDWLDPTGTNLSILNGKDAVITGPDNMVYSSTAIFSSPISGTWTVYPAMQIVSGQGTNAITVSAPPLSSPRPGGWVSINGLIKKLVSFSNSPVALTSIGYSAIVANGSKVVTVTLPQGNVTQSSRQTVDYALTNATTETTVAKGQLPASGGTLDFSRIPAGIYILRIDTGSGTPETFKIILK